MSESRDIMIKRLSMRSMRRGIKEMDLILQAFAEARLAGMDDEGLTLYDQMLNENDHDLYQWVTGQVAAPAPYGDMVSDIQSLLQEQKAGQPG